MAQDRNFGYLHPPCLQIWGIQLSRSNLEYLLNPSPWPFSDSDHHRLSSPSLQHSPYWSHLSVLLPFSTLQLSHIISRIIISREVYIAIQLTYRLSTMTNKTLCDVRSAHLSSLIFPSCPCSVPYTLEAPLKQLLPVPPVEEELCMLVILLAGNFSLNSSLVYLYLHLQKALLGLWISRWPYSLCSSLCICSIIPLATFLILTYLFTTISHDTNLCESRVPVCLTGIPCTWQSLTHDENTIQK